MNELGYMEANIRRMQESRVKDDSAVIEVNTQYHYKEYDEDMITEFEDEISVAINNFRSMYPDVLVLLNGVE